MSDPTSEQSRGDMFAASFQEHLEVAAASAAAVTGELGRAVEITIDALRAGGKVLAFGNGGSAMQAQHLVAELVGRYELERGGVAAVALTADQATVTAVSNDFGFEAVFVRQVEALARPGDVVVAISTSGTSVNVVAGARRARELGCRVVALTGAEGGALAPHADVVVSVPSTRTARVQEIHTLCLHLWCEAVDAWAVGEERPR